MPDANRKAAWAQSYQLSHSTCRRTSTAGTRDLAIFSDPARTGPETSDHETRPSAAFWLSGGFLILGGAYPGTQLADYSSNRASFVTKKISINIVKIRYIDDIKSTEIIMPRPLGSKNKSPQELRLEAQIKLKKIALAELELKKKALAEQRRASPTKGAK